MLILEYMEQHPNAKDTAEGIAEWWVHQPVDLVERALELLMTLGFVVRTSLDLMDSVYELAPGKREELGAWLRRLE